MDRDTKSAFTTDKRAVAPLIGFVLLFGMGIIALSSYQAFVVPQQNAEVEFNHNTDVQSDMHDLRNSLISVRSPERIGEGEYEIVSDHRPVRVRTGTQYPTRLITVNPPSPTGTLRTETPESEVQIDNTVVRTPDAYEGAEELLEHLEGGVETRFLEYQPGYNEYRNAPNTRIEHSLLSNAFDHTDLIVRNQRMIDDRRLNLVLFGGGSPQSSGQTATFDPETIDGPTAPIIIEDDGDPIELTIPTEAPELWESDDVIGESFTEGATRARVIDSDDQTVTIELDPNETYQLRVARVGFDGGSVDEEQFTPIQTKDQEGGATGEPVPGTYEVDWKTDEMEGEEVDEGIVEISVNDGDPDTMDLEVDVLGENGDPVENAAVDFGIDTASPIELGNPGQFSYTDPEGRAQGDLIGLDEADDGDEARIYATAGDNVSSILVRVVKEDETGDPDPTFETLEAEVTNTGGAGQIDQIRLDYQLDPNEEETIDFRVYNDEERTDLIDTIERQSAGEEYFWNVDRGGQDRVPVYIEADIDGGECLTAELEQQGDTAVLNTGDWEDC